MTEGDNAVSAQPSYDSENVFARILRGEIPCRRIYEDEWALAFHDIHPRAPVHVLIVPKGAYVSSADFFSGGSEAEIAGFFRAAGRVAREMGLDVPGYRILANAGGHAHQEVPHFHLHLFGGRPLGPMLVEDKD